MKMFRRFVRTYWALSAIAAYLLVIPPLTANATSLCSASPNTTVETLNSAGGLVSNEQYFAIGIFTSDGYDQAVMGPGYMNATVIPQVAGWDEVIMSLTYCIEAIGPTVPLVTLDISASSQATASGSFTTLGTITVGDSDTIVQGSNTNGGPQNVSLSEISVQPDVPIVVEEILEIRPAAVESGAYVELDPEFTIDPSNPNAGEYSVDVSAGIDNGPVGAMIPEPGSAVLMLTGIGLVATMRKQLP